MDSILQGTLSVLLTDAASDQVDSFRVAGTAIDVVSTTVLHALAGPVVVDLADPADTDLRLNSVTATVGNHVGVNLTLEMCTAVCLLANQCAPAPISAGLVSIGVP